ncbi:adenylate kinase isoenzyme 1 isoform X1 [Bemisia tabaci]|uniref:adenylate kinase isoenzyme 1 isoform X1 n=2 Tax=Bemisia tabaci TaxID=7038 RepID=UPI003B28C870
MNLILYWIFKIDIFLIKFCRNFWRITDNTMPPTDSRVPTDVPIVWVLGGPGCGKGTQCDRIVQKYGFTHISTGDLLRDEVASGSERGQELTAIMKEGKLVPTDIVMSLLKEKIVKELPNTKGFLIDGYPREKEQGIQFERDVAEVSIVLYFEASDETMTQRLLKRAETSGRSDDNAETIKKRLATFHQNNDPIIQQYASKTKTISAERPPDEVFAEVVKYLDELKK